MVIQKVEWNLQQLSRSRDIAAVNLAPPLGQRPCPFTYIIKYQFVARIWKSGRVQISSGHLAFSGPPIRQIPAPFRQLLP